MEATVTNVTFIEQLDNIQTILLYLIGIDSAILACLFVLAFFLGRSSK